MVIEFDIDNRARYSVDGENTWRNISPCEGINCYDAQKEFYSKILGRWESDWENKYKTKEEKDMNKVLELYVEREEKRLREWYKLQEDTEYDNLDIVKEFKKVEEDYVKSMEELRNKYNTIDSCLIQKTGYVDMDMYGLSESIREEIHERLNDEYTKEMGKLSDMKNEIDALLSLSDDKDYQIEVLTKYNILDKKGMMN